MKSRLWFSVFILLGSVSCFALPSEEGDKVKQGLKLMAAGDFSAALTKFRDAQIEYPSSTELHFNIGMALYKLDRYEDARGAFESATFSRNQEIEKKALFHTGNCFVKEGKWEKALDYFNRALQIDPQYKAAKINREFVVRTMKNQARKKKKQDKKKEEEQQIIEKLQKLIAEGVAVHDKSRDMMRAEGLQVEPSSLRDYADLLDAPLDDVLKSELESLEKEAVTKSIAKKQGEVNKTLIALVEEVKVKIEAGKKGQGGGQAKEGQPTDPSIVRLEKALPFLQNAEPNMENATKAVRDDSDLLAAQGFQSVALQDLIAARNELLDELARLIEAEMRVLVDSTRTQRESQTTENPSEEEMSATKAEANQQGEEQKAIRQRTENFGKGVEKHLDDLKSQLDKKTQGGGSGVEAGQDPQEEIRKFEKALTHLNEAARLMEESEPFLAQPDFDNAIPKEKAAARELVLARAALSPPQQQQQQQKDGESEKKEGEEKKESSEPEKSDKKKEEKEEKEAEAKKSEDLTDEQAKKTLEQQKQREMERRRDKKEKEKKARKNKAKGVKKDW